MAERWPSARVLRFGALPDGPVPAGDAQLLPVHTPGHSPDHLCFFDEASGDLFCGDLVRIGGTIVIPATRGGNLRQYLDSLRLVRDLRPRRLLPGHGPIIDRPAVIIEDYLRHRRAARGADRRGPARRRGDAGRDRRERLRRAAAHDRPGRDRERPRALDQARGRRPRDERGGGWELRMAFFVAVFVAQGFSPAAATALHRHAGCQPFGRSGSRSARLAAFGMASRMTCSSSSR